MSDVSAVFFAGGSEAGIRAAFALAVQAGGGTVMLPPTNITLSAALPMASGVKYRGSSWQAMFYNDSVMPVGTVLVQQGTTPNSFPAFTDGKADSTSLPTSFASINAQMLQGCGVTDMSLLGFSHGVKIGAQYIGGAQWSEFKRLNIRNCT